MLPDVVHPLRLGLKNSGQDTSIQALFDVWRIADEAGFDHVWDFDHLASIGPGGSQRSVYEGWTLLAAIAASTQRVRFGCMVTGNTYRHPAVLAKMAVTVDHLSGGRLEFGIGAAWAEAEHEMYGIEGLDHRVGRPRTHGAARPPLPVRRGRLHRAHHQLPGTRPRPGRGGSRGSAARPARDRRPISTLTPVSCAQESH